MHFRELTYLAFLVSRQAPRLLFSGGIPVESQIEYWVAGKTRTDQWMRLMKATELGHHPTQQGETPRVGTRAVESLAAEVFITELLSRVWAAYSCGLDQLGHSPQVEPLAHSVLMGHLQAVERMRRLIGHFSQDGCRMSQLIQQLPEIVAGWTDQLVGWISSWVPVAQYAADPDRAAEFASEWRTQGTQSPLVWKLLRSLIDNRLAALPEGPLGTGESNLRLGMAVLGSLPREAIVESEFASLLYPYWVSRFAEQTQILVDQTIGRED
jgi:hypothetical protein